MIKMGKTGIYALVFGIIYSLLIGYIAFTMGQHATKYATDTINNQVMAESISPTPDAFPSPTPMPDPNSYLIKEVNGKIGIYQNGELLRVVDVDVSTLRPNDAQQIEQGIVLQTDQDLASFLEDYTS